MRLALLVIVTTIVGVNCATMKPFVGVPVDLKDPHFNGLFTKAMTKHKLNTDKVKVLTMAEKLENDRAEYRVAYNDEQGKTCFLDFNVKSLNDDLSGGKPDCNYTTESPKHSF